MTGGGQWEPGARSSISSSVFAMRIAVVVAVSSVLRPVVVVVVATFLVSMLCVCTCVCVDAGACRGRGFKTKIFYAIP